MGMNNQKCGIDDFVFNLWKFYVLYINFKKYMDNHIL